MRVLLMANSYSPVLGGLQTVTRALAHHLHDGGHPVRVVTHRYPRLLPARESIDGVPVDRWLFLRPDLRLLSRRRPDILLASLVAWPHTSARLARLMREHRPDVVNVHFPDAQIPFILRMRGRFRFRLVVSLHGHDVERFFAGDSAAGRPATAAPGGAGALRAVLRQADVVTACSRHLLERAVALEPSAAGKGRVVYNGVDAARFSDKTPYPHPRPYLLAFGRLTHKKGFDLLIDAFSRVQMQYPDIDLVLAGEGEERAALEAQAEQAGLAGRVHFLGRATPGEVVRLLNGCRLAVVPSRQEPFGIVALEALAAGKQVLATRVGGMAEFLAEVCPTSAGVREGYAPAADTGSRGTVSAEAAPPGPVRLVDPTAEALAEGIRACLAGEAPPPVPGILEEHSWDRAAARYTAALCGEPAR